MKKSILFLLILSIFIFSFSIYGIAEEKPQYGGTLVRPDTYGDPVNLDPILTTLTATQMVNMLIFDGLVRLNGATGKIEPAIAKSWEVKNNGKTYIFHLRKGVKFHNGREVKAADFKYSFERIKPENRAPHTFLIDGIVGAKEYLDKKTDHIKGIKVLDDYTLEIDLKDIDVTFLNKLGAWVDMSVVPKEEVEKLGREFGNKPCGTGPFKLEKWVKDSEVVLVANKDYFMGRPYLDKIIFKVMPEASARELAFDSKRLDMMVLTDVQYKKYTRHPIYKKHLIEVAELYTRHIGFNLDWGPLKNKKVRKAINYAIDKETIIKKLLNNKAFPAVGVLPSSMGAFNKNLKGYEYNPEKAKELLKEAGYENGFEVEILTKSGPPAWGLPTVEAVMTYLNKVGIKLKPKLVEGGTLGQEVGNRNFQMYIWSVGGESSPLNYLYTYFHSKNIGPAGNFCGYNNPKVDALLDAAKKEVDPEKRVKLIREAEEIIVDDAPWWFYNYNKAVMVYQPWVHGLQPTATDVDYQRMEKVWVSKH